MKKKLLIWIMLITLSILLLTSCEVKKEYQGDVDCIVVSKKYVSDCYLPELQTVVGPDGNVTTNIINKYYPEEYYTYIYYEKYDLKFTFRDKKTYETYKEGDIIKMKLYKHIDKEKYYLIYK